MIRGVTLGVGALAFALGMGGCGSEEGEASDSSDVQGDTAGSEDEPVAERTYWRVEVQGSASGAAFGDLQQVTVAGDPIPAAGADFMVVAWQGDDVVDARAVRFPTELLDEYADGDGVSSSIAEASEIVFVEAGDIDRLELVAAGGAVLDELEPAALQREEGIGFREAEMPEPLGHVRILGPDELQILPPRLSDRIAKIIEPNARLYEVLGAGLDRAAPAVASAVRTVAVVEFADPSTAPIASTWGSSFVINKAYLEDERLPATVVHEAAHNFHFLLDTAAEPEPYDTWPEAIRNRALQTADKHRLGRGLPQVWRQMHGSAQRYGFAAPYLGDGWRDSNDADAIAGGFASSYGRRHWGEDIAEYVETVQAPEFGEGACPRLQGRGSLDEEIAITYVKLTLLEALGALDRSKYDRCVGRLDIDDSPGIHLGDGALSLRQNLDAGYTEYEGVPWFAFVGEDGEGYGVAVRVHAPNGDDALGIHRLDTIALGRDWTALPGVFVDHENPIYARGSGEGLVVITEASGERTRGVILGLTLLNALGEETDYLPYSPFNVPVR